MRARAIAIAFGCASTFGGCALFQSAPLASKPLAICSAQAAPLQTVCNDATNVIDKADILIAAIVDALDAGLTSGTLAKAQVIAYRAQITKADADLDKAFATLSAGDFANALSQANLTNDLLIALQKEVAAQVAKQGKQ